MTSLAEILHKPENIELIKGIAEEIKAEHKVIPYLPRGEVVPFDEWRKKLIEISEFVNPLVSSNIGLPEIEADRQRGFTRYNNQKRTIYIAAHDTYEYDFIGAAAHENAHHLQLMRAICIPEWMMSEVLKEGFARGIEKLVCREYAHRNNNPRYVLEVLDEIRLNLDSFFNMSRAYLVPGLERERENSNKYAYGTAAFLLAEKINGTDIYRRVFQSHRPYRLLTGFLDGSVKL
ncbi:MAG: hypothetical protein WC852_01005 [Candidatus Nanoarchaeia archaeon]|jgi:hypothetical protein